jgi:hypothetical protein
MSLAVIESKAGFNSVRTELLAAPEFVFTLVGPVVHASAKLSSAANETIAWIRIFILDSSSIPLLDLIEVFYAKRGHKSNSPCELGYVKTEQISSWAFFCSTFPIAALLQAARASARTLLYTGGIKLAADNGGPIALLEYLLASPAASRI